MSGTVAPPVFDEETLDIPLEGLQLRTAFSMDIGQMLC